jgi:CMP-N-acetylneuraminic acid synthetase
MRSIAVIPARGNSTRLKDKNIRLLGDKPLIRWITLAVIEAGVFDEIYISTDDDRIFEAVSDLPVKRHVRPKELAGEKVTVLKAIIDFMKDREGDIIGYFLPTCPFMKSKYIREGWNRIKNENADTSISVSYYQEHIQLACIMKDDSLLPVFDNLLIGHTNSRCTRKYVKENGGFYIGKWKIVERDQNFYKGDVRGVLVPFEDLVDIDYPGDLDLANYKINRELI